MLSVGQKAPDFELENHLGYRVKLSNFRGKIVVLYFYPRAMTSGCTREGLRFNELYDKFLENNAVVIGISTDPTTRLRKFAEKYKFKFLLLSDTEGEVAKKYGVLRKSKTISAERVTFIIDEKGVIHAILRNIKPAEKHADYALLEIKKLSKKNS